MPSHLDAALEYATQRGWPVFPVKARGKRPLTIQGFHKATTDPATIQSWWGRWPDANIGIPCGAQTFCVVDIDPKSGGDDSLLALREEFGAFPETLMQVTGSGGAHYCFQPNPRVGNSASKLGPGIDTRGNDRGYIVVAPSMHELGRRYAWHNPGAPLAPVPGWVLERLEAEKPPSTPVESVPFDAPAAPATLDPSVIEDRARLYLRECEPAIQGCGGHSRLLWACTAMVHGFELDTGTAYRLLAEEYNPRCSPPWNLAKGSEVKEFRRKIEEGAREKRKERGWLLSETGLRPGEASGILMAQAQEAADRLIASATTALAPVAPTKAIPDYVLYPPGLVGDIASLINRTARKPQPLLALATSYAFCGALFGRKIRDEWDLRSNIYCLGVAESGAGKDHSRQVVKKLCVAAGVGEQLLGGEEVTSDAAIATCLERTQSVLFLWDEIGHMLASIKDKAASGHRRGIVPYLMRLTGSASSVFTGKEYADRDRKDVIQPNVCIYGTTVPSVLYGGLSSAEVRDGLLGRLLVFRALDDDPDVNDEGSRACDMPAAIVERIQQWATFSPSPPDGTPDIQSATGVFQVTVPTDEKAQARFLQLRSDVRVRRKQAIAGANAQAPLWSRVEEHARRLALILATGDAMSPDSARISVEHADAACQLALHCMSQFAQAVAFGVADTEAERWIKRVRQIIADAEAIGVSHRELSRRTQALTVRQRSDVIAALLEAGEILRVRLVGCRAFHYFCPPYGADHVEGGGAVLVGADG